MVTKEKKQLLKTNGPRNFNTKTSYLQVIKLSRPICDICQAPENARAQWWNDCPHDPYFTWMDATIAGEAVYEDILDDEGNPTTRKRLVSKGEDEPIKERRPNLHQSPVSARHSNIPSEREAKWASRGLRRVGEVGLETYCEMRDCWLQDTRAYKGGIFCSEDHAKLCGADRRGVFLDVADSSAGADKRRKQLEDIAV